MERYIKKLVTFLLEKEQLWLGVVLRHFIVRARILSAC